MSAYIDTNIDGGSLDKKLTPSQEYDPMLQREDTVVEIKEGNFYPEIFVHFEFACV